MIDHIPILATLENMINSEQSSKNKRRCKKRTRKYTSSSSNSSSSSSSLIVSISSSSSGQTQFSEEIVSITDDENEDKYLSSAFQLKTNLDSDINEWPSVSAKKNENTDETQEPLRGAVDIRTYLYPSYPSENQIMGLESNNQTSSVNNYNNEKTPAFNVADYFYPSYPPEEQISTEKIPEHNKHVNNYNNEKSPVFNVADYFYPSYPPEEQISKEKIPENNRQTTNYEPVTETSSSEDSLSELDDVSSDEEEYSYLQDWLIQHSQIIEMSSDGKETNYNYVQDTIFYTQTSSICC